MNAESDKRIDELSDRVNKLENLAKILGAVALFLGIGGSTLWIMLNNASKTVVALQTGLDNNMRTIDQHIETKVAESKKILDAKSKELASQLEKGIEDQRIARYGDPVSIRDNNHKSVAITRHGNGGNYLSPYPIGQPGLGFLGSTTWVLQREPQSDAR